MYASKASLSTRTFLCSSRRTYSTASYTKRLLNSTESSATGNSPSPTQDLSNFIVDKNINRDFRGLARDLFFRPVFFNKEEQLVLLRCCLNKLDSLDSPRIKRIRRTASSSSFNTLSVRDIPADQCSPFLKEELYVFEEVP